MVEGLLTLAEKNIPGTKPWTECAIHDESNSKSGNKKKKSYVPAGLYARVKVVSEVSVYL
jgi:hypothetical protein